MKVLLFLAFLIPVVTHAKQPCSGNKSSCYKSAPYTANGMVHAVTNPSKHFDENAGIYYAKGVGSSCVKAKQNGIYRMADDFHYLTCGGESVKCGVNGGPYVPYEFECKKTQNGNYVVWVQCDNLFHSELTPKPQPQGGAAGIILIEAARRGERKARASR